MSIDKVYPHSEELEKYVLSSAINDKEWLLIVLEILHVDVFYNYKHAKIFTAIKLIHDTKMQVDITAVIQKLKELKELDNIGGAYEVTLIKNNGLHANTEIFCRVLQEYYFRRQLIDISIETNKRCFDDSFDVFNTMDYLTESIRNIEKGISTDTEGDVASSLEKIIADVEKAKEKGGILGLSTGMTSLDYGLMGVRPGLKYEIAACPGEGKTALVKSMGIHFADVENAPGLFLSMEMTRQQMLMSIISQYLRIPNHLLQTGQITDVDKKRILEIKNSRLAKNFNIVDKPALSPKEVRNIVRKFKDEHNIQWVAIDYLGLQKLKDGDERGKNQEQKISEITAENKNIAKEFEVALFELSQFSRERNKRSDPRPRLHDLKDSSAIEANADVVIFPYRPEYHGIKTLNSSGQSSEGFAELIIAKNRFGPLKNLAARFEKEYTAFKTHEDAVELDIVTSSDDDVSF